MRTFSKYFIGTALACLTGLIAIAQEAAPAAAAAAPATGGGGNFILTRYLLVGIAVVLAFIILILANGIRTAANINIDKQKEERRRKTFPTTVLVLFSSLLSLNTFAQVADAATAAVPAPAPGLSLPFDIYIYLAVIFVELLVIIASVFTLYRLFGLKNKKKEALAKAGVKEKTFFQKINSTVAVEDEDKLDLQHNYDGIRELDNRVPGWWSIAFYATILFGVVYLYRMFVSGTLPDQITELQKDNEIAAIKQAAFLKNSASNVDENTVKMLDASGIASGADLFTKNCVACHGDKGQGNAVGPNLTDDYWLHKGSINDVFKTIKYGVPEKGMRAWKDDFSPAQIAELSSYVKSIHGTNPPGAKEPQGEPYTDAGAAPANAAAAPAADSAAAN